MPGLDRPVDETVEGDAVVVRINHVIGAIAADSLSAEGGNRCRREVDRQAVVVWLVLATAQIERARRKSGGDNAEQPAREHVGHVDLATVPAMGEDHVRAKYRHR